jgi:hypothetical protein
MVHVTLSPCGREYARPHAYMLAEAFVPARSAVVNAGLPEDRKSREARPPLTPEAERALAEAKARRESAAEEVPRAREISGPKGPEPVRYGDWEVKGLASDF